MVASLRFLLLPLQSCFLGGYQVTDHLPLTLVFSKMSLCLLERMNIDLLDITA